MPPYELPPPMPSSIAPHLPSSIAPHPERFALVRLFNELRNTPPIGAVGLREFRDLLASLFPEFADVRDEELDSFLDAYVQETMSPRTPEHEWETRENNSRHPEPEGQTF